MYAISDYWKMLADHRRRDAYAEAIRRAVRPGATVVNIGAGTGVFALMAARFGAGRVYAIEPDRIIEVAKELAAANGLSDRIEFIQGLSTEVELPAPADVIVSDLRGVLPLLGHHIPSIVDARRRLLAGDGVLVPQSDRIWGAVVEAPDLYERLVAPWGEATHDLDFESARQFGTNRWSSVRVHPDQLLVGPELWAVLDYRTVEGPNVQGSMQWVAQRPGVCHGLCLWFDTTLVDGVAFSSAPDQPELIYASGFFPWEEPVPLQPGDVVRVDVAANLVGSDYVWRWEARVHGPQDELKVTYEQTNFLAAPVPPATLLKGRGDHVPSLNEDGEVTRAILEMMAGESSVAEIAARVNERFPGQFPGPDEALARVQRLSRRYGR